MATCILHAISLLPNIWDETLNYVNHIQNISPHRSVKDQNPFEERSGRKLEVTHFQIFGSCAWAHVPSEKRKELDPQSTTCIFVGYLDGVKGYKLLYIIPIGSSLSVVFSIRKLPYMRHWSHMQRPLYHFLHQTSVMMSLLTQIMV